MPGIVIVSHSQKLAQGVVELASQMTQGQVSIALAGGIDDPENPIGTDAMEILAAIESVYSEDGVVVLMDLGSAILSAEMALEFLPPEQQAHVHLCAAPLVEGAVAAAVQAAAGSSAEVVMQEAMSALEPKLSQLGVVQASESSPELEKRPTDAPSAKITLIIQNRMGLHARPAARFVSTAGQFQADITVQKGERTANAKSMNQVATLGVRQGDEIQITAVGEDADSALSAIRELAADNFGEEESLPITSETAKEIERDQLPAGALPGIAASPGIALGPVFLYQPRLPDIRKNEAEDPAAEWGRLQTAVHQAQQDLQALIQQTTQQAGADEAAIFAAHQLMLQDPDLLQSAKERLMQEKVNAEYVWQQLIQETAVRYRSLEDEYQRARANDVLDAGNQVLRHLVAAELPALEMDEPVIMVASDLTPSDTARLDPDVILGIVTELGGATAHSAILARALGIPAVVGVGTAVHQLTNEQTIALDGEKGIVFHQLDEKAIADLQEQRAKWLAARTEAQKSAQETAVTQDGHRIEIAANIGGLHDATVALQNGAEGVGLFRTEFLFMGRDAAPTEAEQLAVYQQIATMLGKRPLIIRTLDIGGDKPLPYLTSGPQEDNPFLGLRGIRFCLANRDIFRPQLRAILRASQGTNIKLMFPMIGTLSELRAAKDELDAVRAELRGEQIPFDENMEVGMMVEVPAAVAIADQLAQEVDFFSIGTNDLTQYVMAADRGNAQVAELVDALQPAVLRLIQQTATAAHRAGIWVGICGELASRPQVTPLLVGLGIDELSMNAPAIPAVKAAVRQCKKAEVEEIATAVLNLESAKSVAGFLDM